MRSGFLGRGIGPSAFGGGGQTASWQVTTTGAETLTIAAFTVSAATVVDWGDGSSDTYSGAGARTHNYAGAGTWTVRVMQPLNVTVLDMRDTLVTLNSAGIASMTNMATFQIRGLAGGVFNLADISAWRPTSFAIINLSASVTGALASASIAAWRCTTFNILNAPGLTGPFNSSDLTAWNPTETFSLRIMGAGFTGTFNSSDITAWRVVAGLYLCVLPGMMGTINSADLTALRPLDFSVYLLHAGFTGTFNSADLSAWRPTTGLALHSNPGFTGTFNSADLSAWRAPSFVLTLMSNQFTGTFDFTDLTAWPLANFTMQQMTGITFSNGASAGWPTANTVHLENNAFSQAQVDAILWGMYQASITPRTGVNGTIDVSGSNAAPSGTFQACASPPVSAATPGKEIAYELLNDSLGLFNNWATVTITA